MKICSCFLFLKIFFFNLFDSEKGNTSRGRGGGRNRLPTELRARRGARSQDSGIMTWAEGRCLTTELPRRPFEMFYSRCFIVLAFTLRSLVHFRLLFVCDVTPSLWRTFLANCMYAALLSFTGWTELTWLHPSHLREAGQCVFQASCIKCRLWTCSAIV